MDEQPDDSGRRSRIKLRELEGTHKHCGAREATLNSAISAISKRNEEIKNKILKDTVDKAILHSEVDKLRARNAELTRQLREDRPDERNVEGKGEEEEAEEEEDVPLTRRETPPVDVDVFVISGAGAFSDIQRAMQQDAVCSKLKLHIRPPGDTKGSGKSRRALVVVYSASHAPPGQMAGRGLDFLRKTNNYSFMCAMVLRPELGSAHALPPGGDVSYKVVEVDSSESLGRVDAEKIASLRAVAAGFVASK